MSHKTLIVFRKCHCVDISKHCCHRLLLFLSSENSVPVKSQNKMQSNLPVLLMFLTSRCYFNVFKNCSVKQDSHSQPLALKGRHAPLSHISSCSDLGLTLWWLKSQNLPYMDICWPMKTCGTTFLSGHLNFLKADKDPNLNYANS